MDIILHNKVAKIEKDGAGLNWSKHRFVNISPTNNATGIDGSNIFKMEPYFGVDHTSTNVQISTNIDFNTIDWEYTIPQPATQVSFPVNDLLPSTVYYWRYRYQGSVRGWSAFSTPTKFTTAIAFWDGFVTSSIGLSYGGGYFAGVIDTTSSGGERYALILSPKAQGQSATTLMWKTENTASSGTDSKWDGWTNTLAMNDASHPAAQFTRSLMINGYDDWYLPAVDELELLYRYFKPSTHNNFVATQDWLDLYANRRPYDPRSFGYNPSSDPVGQEYTLDYPLQTGLTQFRVSGGEDFAASSYWSSSEYGSTNSFGQSFGHGRQGGNSSKATRRRVRAVRRLIL